MASSANQASDAILFTDIFDVSVVNPEGKKFERVNRLVCRGETLDAELTLDVASEAYDLRAGDKFTLTLASTLRLDGQPEASPDEYNQDGKPSLLDSYEYGMCGRVFRYDAAGDNKVAVIASFGGLLMQLVGEARHLVRVRMDERVYLLARKRMVGGV